jgi:hypothetical protein
MSEDHWEYPPSAQEAAEEWSHNHNLDAVAFAAGWTQSGQGYGPKQARPEWPFCPGFDWCEGLPDWDCGLEEEPEWEYRTALMDCGPYSSPPIETKDGWKLVASFGINPEPDLFDDSGSACGFLYVGEGSYEAVYRKPD